MQKTVSDIRTGPAGWNYKDWYGIVYPAEPGKTFKELDFIAKYFDTVEINSSFYHPPNLFTGKAWAGKTAHNPRFKFTAKLWQRFTHERSNVTEAEVRLVRQGIDPLQEAGVLGAVLIQFPWSYRNTEENRQWLIRLFEWFSMYPLVTEIRHLSWDTPAFYALLEDHQTGFATIDQPVIGKSIEFKPVRVGPIGYVRLHGRNYKDWFPNKQDNKPAFARYDYLYSEEEIRLISNTVKTVAEGAKETYVIQNNHPRGQAIANAAQIRAELGESLIKLPETLFTHFPELHKIALPE